MAATGEVRERVMAMLDRAGIAHEVSAAGAVVAILPGTAKLRTAVSLAFSEHGIVLNAFVCRAPEEHREQVYRLLLARNARLAGVSFALDRLGDIYLVGHLPLAAVDDTELDRMLGTILEQSDGTFNHLVRLGFAGAIAREHAWRSSRGLDQENLRALLPADPHASDRPVDRQS